MTQQVQCRNIAQALFTVNRHAKTAPKPQHLYQIKNEAIKKLLREKRAKKIGLHFSENPKYSNQHSTLLIKVNNYFFHIPPNKQDFKQLKHLGALDKSYRNPPTKMSLSSAKRILYNYIGWKTKKPKSTYRKRSSGYYIPSSLGNMNWPPKKSHHHY